MSSPKISVVVAVRNGAATLSRCLESVWMQTYPHKELIVMDGASTDDTPGILRAHGEKIAFWESAPDRGIYHAWNKALAHVTGDWICFVGSDDFFWSEDTLACLTPHLADAERDGERIVYGQVAIVDAQGALIRLEGREWQTCAGTFSRAMSVPHPGMMHHRNVFDEHGGFDETFRICADYDFLLRELPRRPARFAPDVITVGVQRGGISYSPAAMGMMLQELGRVRRKHGLPTPGLWDSPPVLWKMRLCALCTRLIGPKGFQAAADGYRRARGKSTA